MSVLPVGVYANPTQPLWTPFGGGGGSGSNFDTLNINAEGFLNMGNDSNFDGAQLNFYRDPAGSNQSSFQMLWAPGQGAPFNNPDLLYLSLITPSNTYDDLIVGNLRAVGSNNYGAPYALTIGTTTNSNLAGMTWGTYDTPFFTLFSVSPSDTSWDLNAVGTINGKELAQAGTDTTSGSSVVVTLPTAYADSNYAVVVTPFSQETMWVTSNTPSNFEVNTAGSNVAFSWIAMPYT